MALPPPVTEVPLREAVERYLEACRAKARAQSMAPATVKNYTWDLERFLDLLPGTVLHTTESVTGEEIDQALRAFAHGTDHHAGTTTALGQRSRVPGPVTDTDVTVSRSTLRMRRSIARFFTYAVEQSWATVTPLRGSRTVPAEETVLRRERTALGAEQAHALLTYGPGTAETNKQHDRDTVALGLLTMLGLQAGEVARLDIDHYTVASPAAGARLQVIGRVGSGRVVPVPPQLAQQIDAYRARLGEETPAPLLLSPTGRRLAARDIERLVERAVKRTQATDPQHARAVVPHGLRRTAATLMLNEGWDMQAVGHMLGHRSVSTTLTYLQDVPLPTIGASTGDRRQADSPSSGVT